MRFLVTISLLALSFFAKGQSAPAIGIVQDLSSDSIAYQAGYTYLVTSIAKYVSPKNVTAEQFKENLSFVKKLKTPLYAFNLFIPSELKLVGNEVNEKAILDYTRIVLQRCEAMNVKLIVWGSGGARKIPEGFDRARATEQFVSIARKIAMEAERHNVIIALENLNRTETNFINTLSEALEIVKKVDHANLRLCADLYHMSRENESPALIERAGKFIVHCDIAEKENRTPPGVKGDDFKPYFKALKKIKYKGALILECQWDNLNTQADAAFRYVDKELNSVFGQ